MSTASVRKDDEYLYIIAPYRQKFVEELKELVDRDSRSWSAATKMWKIDAAYEKSVLELLRRYFTVEKKDTPATAWRAGRADIFQKTLDDLAEEWTHTAKDAPMPFPDVAVAVGVAGGVQPEWQEFLHKYAEIQRELDNARTALQAQKMANELSTRNANRVVLDLKRQLELKEVAIRELQRRLRDSSGMSYGYWGNDGGWNIGFGDGRHYAPRGSSSTSAYRVLGLDPAASMEVCMAAYKAMMLKHHPDRGGDLRRAQEINAAYDEIKREKGIS